MEGSIEEVLTCNNVNNQWRDLILEFKGKLVNIFDKVRQDTFSPTEDFIFKAFSYFDPKDTKVIIICQNPIRPYKGVEYATGLSVSINSIDCDLGEERIGATVWKVHEALKSAGILEVSRSYPCQHEEWAKKGILLLNTYLTVGPITEDDYDNPWQDFTSILLRRFIQVYVPNSLREEDKPIFIMRWGKKAQRGLENYYNSNVIIMDADHPVRRTPVEGNFLEVVPEHFREINNCYPGIFSIIPVTNGDGDGDGDYE